MRKTILLSLLTLLLSLSIATAYTAGTTFTQDQLDKARESTKEDLYVGGQVPSISRVTSQGDKYLVHYPLLQVRYNEKTTRYGIYEVEKQIPLRKSYVKKCLSQNTKEHCVQNVFMPFVRNYANFQIKKELANIESYKTKTDTFTEQDLFGRGLN